MMDETQNIPRRGILFVVSAPSGAGKTTLCNALRQTKDFVYSVSCTTRGPRSGEIDGEDYFFLTKEEFARRVENGEFLEYAAVHGHHYGTLRSTVLEHLDKGVDVLLDIDIQGAAAIRACVDVQIIDALADVFIMPPGREELRHRLVKRGTETTAEIEVRLKNAVEEMKNWRLYKYSIISQSVEEDLQKFRSIMKAERYLSRRLLLDL
jgi:guanylate kinase